MTIYNLDVFLSPFGKSEKKNCSMYSSNCCFLTHIHVCQETSKVVWYSYHLKNFPQFVVVHTVNGFSIVNEAEVDVFSNSFAFTIQQMLATWPLVPLPFLNPACTSGSFPVHVLLKPSLKDFEHSLTSMWNEHKIFMVIWTFFGIALLWDWNENWPFPVLWPLLGFPNFQVFECGTLTTSSFRI